MYLIFIATIYATFCGFDKIELTYLSSPIDYLSNDTQYHMNICSPVHNSVCKTTSLLCDISNQSVINLADYSSDPLWSYINSSIPMFGIQALYNNGDVCMMNQTYKVNIQYLCDKMTSGHFDIEKTDNCSYTVRQKVNCNAQPLYPSEFWLSGYIGILIFSAIALPFLLGGIVQKYQQCKNMSHINWYGTRQECIYNIKQLFRCGRKYNELEENLNP
jgi:hypothetical protein